jgi:hypothetical protein
MDRSGKIHPENELVDEPEQEEGKKQGADLTRPRSERRRWFKVICEDIPFINLVYDLLFDAIPSMDGVKDTLNLLGLIDALVLGFSLSVLTSCDFYELTDADNRFMTREDDSLSGYHDLYDNPNLSGAIIGSPSSQYAFNSYTSIICLFVSLICVLVTYLDLSNKNFAGRCQYEINLEF